MIWDYVRHFTPSENWGLADRMNGLLILLLDAVRDRWGDSRFIIHCGYEADSHVKDSYHKSGNAADFHIESSLSFSDQIKRMELVLKDLQVFDKVGLGIYPDWNTPGFHLDIRGSYARWGRIGRQYVGYPDIIEHARTV